MQLCPWTWSTHWTPVLILRVRRILQWLQQNYFALIDFSHFPRLKCIINIGLYLDNCSWKFRRLCYLWLFFFFKHKLALEIEKYDVLPVFHFFVFCYFVWLFQFLELAQDNLHWCASSSFNFFLIWSVLKRYYGKSEFGCTIGILVLKFCNFEGRSFSTFKNKTRYFTR